MFEELMELEAKVAQLSQEIIDTNVETIARLDKYQDEFTETTRRLNDIDHMIELGENLSRNDVTELFELRRTTLVYRRELKETLGCYIPNSNSQALFNNGTVYKGEYSRYKKPPTHKKSRYSLRSDSDKNSSIVDFLDGVSFGDEKFSKIARDVPKEVLDKLRVWGTL